MIDEAPEGTLMIPPEELRALARAMVSIFGLDTPIMGAPHPDETKTQRSAPIVTPPELVSSSNIQFR